MNPIEIRFLRTEVSRTSTEALNAWHVYKLKAALVETLAAYERFVSDAVDAPCDVPVEAIETLPIHFEFLPGRMAPPIRRKRRKPKG